MKPSTLITAVVLIEFTLLSSSYATDTTKSDKAAKKTVPTAAVIAQKTSTQTVSEGVQLSDRKITGAWLENAADGSWRRVAFVLHDNVATVTFGDGKSGSRVPSVMRYAYAGPGSKNAKLDKTQAVYSEVHAATDATPKFLAKANQSSLVPAEVASRVREFGGDMKVLQQLADFKRISELGSAFDAARGAAADNGVFGNRPGDAPDRKAGGWQDPREGVGRDGRASDAGDRVISSRESVDANGHRSSSVTRHSDGSTTEVYAETRNDGSTRNNSRDTDPSGKVTRSRTSSTRVEGDAAMSEVIYESKTGETRTTEWTRGRDGSWSKSVDVSRRTPSETPYSGRGGIDEAWMDKSLPWFMDAVYVAWKRESDLIQSGARVAQPGQDEGVSPGTREAPRVGSDAVTNCGDSGANPCVRPGGTTVDVRGRFGGLSQPGRGDPKGGPGSLGVPEPRPIPLPKQ